jgi:hypothetical protein
MATPEKPRLSSPKTRASPESTPDKKPRPGLGWIIAGFCMLMYLASGQSLAGNDATANVHLVPRLLGHGSVYFTVHDNPKMFAFALQTPDGMLPVQVTDWTSDVHGTLAREAFERGDLQVVRPFYYLAPTRHEGKYANTFGLGAGLFALPIIGPVQLVTDLEAHLNLLWWLAKLAAALSVAGTVLLLFRAGVQLLHARAAAVVALAYGLGTCAFCISSQALWQNGPCEFFIALGSYFLLVRQRKSSDILCGFGFAMAALCRPTAALVLVSVGAYLLLFDRRRVLRFTFGALPVVLLLVLYNQYTFGSPWMFGQMSVESRVALKKTGNPDAWSTPLHVGLAGLLFSPARGLFVYSPTALFSVWGILRAFRDSTWKDLRPLAIAAILQVLLAAKWFDWWGGWCFGYRLIVDTAILLGFLAFPIVAAVERKRAYQALFAGLFVYSLGVQLIGTYVFDLSGWNAKIVWQVMTRDKPDVTTFDDKAAALRFARERHAPMRFVTLNIDNPDYRDRLWSFSDSPLIYYLKNISRARALRRQVIESFLRDDG